MHAVGMNNLPQTDEERRQLVGDVERQLRALLAAAERGDLDTAAGSRVLVGCLVRHVQGALAVLDTLLEPSSPYYWPHDRE
jgi:hypothetical protein